MHWFPRSLSLHSKLDIFIYLGIFIMLLNFPLIYIDITNMNRGILNLELAEDLYNTILEMRRYEKNFFLYQNMDDLAATLHHFNRAKELSSKRPNPFQPSGENGELVHLGERLKDYGSLFEMFKKTSPLDRPDEGQQNKIRSVGKEVVHLAHSLLKRERGHLGRVAKNALRWPLVFMGAMFSLFVLGATITTKQVIKPLGKIEEATEKIARGDFSPIARAGKVERQVDHLIAAFNRMAQELEAREEQIIHSRKVASLGTLVSGTAHELNNPINNIILTVDALVGGRKKMAEQRRRRLLEDILSQALRASEIVKNLLDFSRAETSGYHELDLSKLLRETLQIAQNHILLAKVKLREEIAEDLPNIYGRREGLQQVFLNMITNAVQAMPEGGELTVRAGLEEGNKVKIEFKDTGIGIPAENLPKIFDPFFTTKEVGQGTGLGLSVSYGIVKKHGGQILVKSAVGEGTTFTVLLPISRMEANAA